MKKIQIWINLFFFFSKNVTPPSYIDKMQLLYDKDLQSGYFCLFIVYIFPKNTKYNANVY